MKKLSAEQIQQNWNTLIDIINAHIGDDRIVIAGNLTMNPFSHIQTLENRGLGQWRSVYGNRGNVNRL